MIYNPREHTVDSLLKAVAKILGVTLLGLKSYDYPQTNNRAQKEGVFQLSRSGPCVYPWDWEARSAQVSHVHWKWWWGGFSEGSFKTYSITVRLLVFWDPRSKEWDAFWTEILMADPSLDTFWHSLTEWLWMSYCPSWILRFLIYKERSLDQVILMIPSSSKILVFFTPGGRITVNIQRDEVQWCAT